jgi:hypothetical protein
MSNFIRSRFYQQYDLKNINYFIVLLPWKKLNSNYTVNADHPRLQITDHEVVCYYRYMSWKVERLAALHLRN